MNLRTQAGTSLCSFKGIASSRRLLAFGVLFLAGFAVVFVIEAAHRIEAQGLRLVAGADPIKVFSLMMAGSVALLVLLRYPEVTLAIFFLVGLVKGDPRLASAPMDLTLAVGGVLIITVCYRLFVGKQPLKLPTEYFLYLPLLIMMVLSLTYTPDFSGGVEKILRFVCLTSIGILSPFVLLDERSKIVRFFVTLAAGGLLVAIQSMSKLGGEDRLVSPSGLNTELGAASAVALIIIWGLIFPNWSFVKRLVLYPALGVLAVALVGSGGRFANVSAVICILVGALLCRKLFGDMVIAGILGLFALPFITIPEASLEYLSSLARPTGAMGTRNDLLALGVQIFSEHPLIGVGISGFRARSPNPLTYNYPHNLFLELGSEMGILAGLVFLLLAFSAFREAIRQLRDPMQRGNPLVHTIFLLLIYVFLDAMVSGDINDLRFMWFIFGLPFLLRELDSVPRVWKIPAEALARTSPSQLSPRVVISQP